MAASETLRAGGNRVVTHVELGEDKSLFGHDIFLLDLVNLGCVVERGRDRGRHGEDACICVQVWVKVFTHHICRGGWPVCEHFNPRIVCITIAGVLHFVLYILGTEEKNKMAFVAISILDCI